ncbi:MAG: hypothetical protein AAGG07_13715 [Planctomycetota bacterium]
MRFAPYLLGLSLLAGTAAGQTYEPDDELPGDFDGDRIVDADDIADVNDALTAWNASAPHTAGSALFSDGDVDRDGDVDSDDVALVVTHLGHSLPVMPSATGISVAAHSVPHVLRWPAYVSSTTHSTTGLHIRNEFLWENGPGASYYHPDTASYPLLQPTIVPAWKSDGVDYVFTWDNSSGTKPASWGAMRMPIFRTSGTPLTPGLPQIQYRFPDKNTGTADISVATASDFSAVRGVYPNTAYAPAVIIRDNSVGMEAAISMQAPILDFDIETGIYYTRSSGKTSFYFLPNYYNGNLSDPERYWHEGGQIPAGETRKITVSVRFREVLGGEHSGEWLRGLQTYRRYFRWRHGGTPAYTRDARPVSITNLASNGTWSSGNPRGFNTGTSNPWTAPGDNYLDLKADLVADATDGPAGVGWQRAMLSAVSGKYIDSATSDEVTFPPFPATGLYESFPGTTAGVATELENFTLVSPNTLGFWWGRSHRLRLDGSGNLDWDVPVANLTDYDPDSSSGHFDFYEDELDNAALNGVTEIGLDAFAYLTPRERYFLLRRLQAYSDANGYGMRFVVEPVKGDLMHRLAPAFVQVLEANGDDKNTEPPVLADFLLPGHELWGNITLGRYKASGFPSAVPADVLDVMEDIGNDGYVSSWSFHWSGGGLKPSRTTDVDDATESWLTTVPSDLQY